MLGRKTIPITSNHSRRCTVFQHGGGLYTVQLLFFMILFVSGGASCPNRQRLDEVFAPPVVFEQTPSLDELTQHLNQSLRIETLESNNLTVTSPEISVKLRGELVWERPHNFKFSAFAGPIGKWPVLAAGSNDQMFWLQTQMPPPPTLVYANYNEFNSQLGPRKVLPVSPLWLREALGIVELDPTDRHEGPNLRADGKLELVSYIMPSQRGQYRRVLVFDATHGTLEQTLLYEQRHGAKEVLIAHAAQSEHVYNSSANLSLPHRVDVELRPDGGEALAFTIEVGFYMINEASSYGPGTFAMPDATGLSTYNLVQLNAAEQPMAATPPTYTQVAPMQSYRGNFPVLR